MGLLATVSELFRHTKIQTYKSIEAAVGETTALIDGATKRVDVIYGAGNSRQITDNSHVSSALERAVERGIPVVRTQNQNPTQSVIIADDRSYCLTTQQGRAVVVTPDSREQGYLYLFRVNAEALAKHQ